MTKIEKSFIYKTDLGEILISEEDCKISKIIFSDFLLIEKLEETPLIKSTFQQITEYLNGKRKDFDLPLLMNGTPYQQKVWDEILKIPYGETASYKDIAIRSGNPNGSRSVGNAVGKNSLLIVVPCHRIIRSNGNLGGFACGLDKKRKLMTLENIKVIG